MKTVTLTKLQVAQLLHEFIEQEVLPDSGLESSTFWKAFERILLDYTGRNAQLLQRRQQLQQHIDDWHRQQEYSLERLDAYQQFLREIGYLEPEPEDFEIDLDQVDPEISDIAGPQLVVPINNARFAINAANARWGSLFDALYSSDVLPRPADPKKGSGVDPQRAQQVFDFCNDWLDQVLPLRAGNHADVVEYAVQSANHISEFKAVLQDQTGVTLKNPDQFRGHCQDDDGLWLLFTHHRLHIELKVNGDTAVGRLHPANLSDIQIEAAPSTIQDCEDSVSAVDVSDKLQVYRNWLGLMKGTLSCELEKGGKCFTRSLNPDRQYQNPHGESFTLSGRSLMFIRNTGLHMMTDLVQDGQGNNMPEGLIDALVTVLIALHDLRSNGVYKNSRCGNIYIVKPKLHGSQEVEFCVEVFAAIEQAFQLPANSIKIGVMDEERRSSVNLKSCIAAARERIVFINTGFLDRTGDEIHSSMLAGAMLPKSAIKQAPWIKAYEDRNVDLALGCGFSGQAQIGKGMWAEPDEMRAMYQSKSAHPQAGASCAWVPSPTAAVIHALHYHQTDVQAVQQKIKQREPTPRQELLKIPLIESGQVLNDQEIQSEMENNVQGILGYVVKWIELGIGCSKVPDIHNTGLMEDRATLRISSQLLANWRLHGLFSHDQLMQCFQRMARIVDEQNLDTPGYQPMAPGFDGYAFRAAVELVEKGAESPGGYTEDCLHRYRRLQKSLQP